MHERKRDPLRVHIDALITRLLFTIGFHRIIVKKNVNRLAYRKNWRATLARCALTVDEISTGKPIFSGLHLSTVTMNTFELQVSDWYVNTRCMCVCAWFIFSRPRHAGIITN